MPTALFISPHLDDVAFSCGGALIKRADEGWRTILLTVFTRSVMPVSGFALACQLDKGLSAEIDYMALRRTEDIEFARLAGAAKVEHLDFREAPHRGYESAAGLFAGINAGDDAWREVAEVLTNFDADEIYAPQALGDHVDHLQTARAVVHRDFAGRVLWYRDMPYASRQSVQRGSVSRAPEHEAVVDVSAMLDRKIDACAAYRTQIPFQFGDVGEMGSVLRTFHAAEARRTRSEFSYAEVFCF